MTYEPRKNPPPRAFKGSTEDAIHRAINATAVQMMWLAKPQFTPEELLDLFVEPALHRSLSTAFAENHSVIEHYLYVSLERWGPKGQLQFSWYHHKVPTAFFTRADYGGTEQHPLEAPRPGARQDNLEKFQETMRRMVQISYEWGLVKRVFDELNKPGYCTTPQQMRFVWPSILPLLKRTGTNDELVRHLQTESIRAGDRARIPTGVQPFIRETYDVVTRSILITEHKAEDKTKDHIKYTLKNPIFTVSGFSFEGFTTP